MADDGDAARPPKRPKNPTACQDQGPQTYNGFETVLVSRACFRFLEHKKHRSCRGLTLLSVPPLTIVFHRALPTGVGERSCELGDVRDISGLRGNHRCGPAWRLHHNIDAGLRLNTASSANEIPER
jgi:hypothetical protein